MSTQSISFLFIRVTCSMYATDLFTNKTPVGKISCRVCLVRYPGPQELEKEKLDFGSLTPSSRRSAGSSRKTLSRFTRTSKNFGST